MGLSAALTQEARSLIKGLEDRGFSATDETLRKLSGALASGNAQALQASMYQGEVALEKSDLVWRHLPALMFPILDAYHGVRNIIDGRGSLGGNLLKIAFGITCQLPMLRATFFLGQAVKGAATLRTFAELGVFQKFMYGAGTFQTAARLPLAALGVVSVGMSAGNIGALLSGDKTELAGVRALELGSMLVPMLVFPKIGRYFSHLAAERYVKMHPEADYATTYRAAQGLLPVAMKNEYAPYRSDGDIDADRVIFEFPNPSRQVWTGSLRQKTLGARQIGKYGHGYLSGFSPNDLSYRQSVRNAYNDADMSMAGFERIEISGLSNVPREGHVVGWSLTHLNMLDFNGAENGVRLALPARRVIDGQALDVQRRFVHTIKGDVAEFKIPRKLAPVLKPVLRGLGLLTPDGMARVPVLGQLRDAGDFVVVAKGSQAHRASIDRLFASAEPVFFNFYGPGTRTLKKLPKGHEYYDAQDVLWRSDWGAAQESLRTGVPLVPYWFQWQQGGRVARMHYMPTVEPATYWATHGTSKAELDALTKTDPALLQTKLEAMARDMVAKVETDMAQFVGEGKPFREMRPENFRKYMASVTGKDSRTSVAGAS